MEELDNHLKVIYILLLRFIRPWVSVSENISPTSGYCSTNRKARKYTALKTNSYQKHIKFLQDSRPVAFRIRAFRVVHLHTIRDSKTHSHPPWRWGSKPWWIAANCCGLVFLIQNGRALLNVFFLRKKVLYLYYQILVNWRLSLHIFFQTCASIFMCIIIYIYDYLYTFNHKCQALACDISCRSITEEQCQHHRKRALCRLQSPRIFQSEVWCLSSQGPSSPHHP